MKDFIDEFDEQDNLIASELVRGRLKLTKNGYEILKEVDSTYGSVQGRYFHGSSEDEVIVRWVPQDCGWKICASQGQPGIIVVGTDNCLETSLIIGVEIPLLHLTEIRVGNKWFRFRRVAGAPEVDGEVTPSVELNTLQGRPLRIGRKVPLEPGNQASQTEESYVKWGLDEDFKRMSRDLIEISSGGNSGVTVRRLKADALIYLNNVILNDRRLVYGDRIEIQEYHFEFTGNSVRQMDRWAYGNLTVRGLQVQVPTPKGPKLILKGIDCDIWSGEFIGIIGGSGQGKSTFMNALCGINPATAGEVVVDGVPLKDREQMKNLSLGFVPQDDIVHRDLVVEDALNLSARLRLKLGASDIKVLVDGVIDRLQLVEHRTKKISDLSGGQRKRVSIATELLAKPSILFLDEPSSGLDPATEEELMGLLADLAKTGLTVICTTHVLENANLFRRVCFIHGGRAIFMGPAEDAVEYFGKSLRKVYSDLKPSGEDADERLQEFQQTRLASDQIRRFPPPPAVVHADNRKRAKVGFFTSLRLLLKRQWKILVADKLNLLFLLAQSVLIGGLVGWVSDAPGFQMFLAVIATMWFGCSNAAQQIIGELQIYRRERIAGLSLSSYVLSKFGFLMSITAVQAMLLFITLTISASLFHPLNLNPKKFNEALRKRDSIGRMDSSVAASQPKPVDAKPAPTSPPVADTPSLASGAVKDEASEGSKIQLPEIEPPAEEPKEETVTSLIDGDPKQDWTWQEHVLWLLAKHANLEMNILASESRYSMKVGFVDETEISPKTIDEGLSPWRIVGVTMGLRIGALMLAALVGVAMGLTVSSLAQSNTQAVMWVPLILIPQILFGGYVVTSPEMLPSVRIFSSFMPSHAAQQMSDVSHIYGQRVPKMTNQTKIPAFLSNQADLGWDGSAPLSYSKGSDEIIKWIAGKSELEQKYDKTAPHNVAWQNLTVIAESVGQRRKIESGGKIVNSVNKRADVVYPRFSLYTDMNSALEASVILGAWVIFCYALISFTLKRRQYGK